MKKRHIFLFIGGLLAALLLTAAIGLFKPAPVPVETALAQGNATLLVSAAASLQDALKAIDPLFAQTQTNLKTNYNFGASGTLQRQIEQGAPVDVFISAAAKQMDALQQKNLILTGTRRNLLTNRLVLIVPKNSTLGLTGFSQLTSDKVNKIAIGEPRSVPVGHYTEELFKNLGILEKVRPKLVLGSNARGVLAAVESGNADAGIVYATDAKISSQVKQVATAPARLHSPIVYPIAVLKDSKNPQSAQAYTKFLSGSQAKAIFRNFGFGTV